MLRLYVTRHGQTVWNVQHRMQGQQDSPLTPTGIAQAQRLALRLRELPIDGIIHSPLPRAIETAHILGEGRTVPIIPDERIIELGLGKWEGSIMPEMDRKYPVEFGEFWTNPNLHMDMRGGESFDSLVKRTSDFLKYAGMLTGRWIVVSHALALRAIRLNVKGLAIEESRVRMPSCTFCQLDWTGAHFDMRTFDDSYHLYASFGNWWHGSDFPGTLTTLRKGSTITRIRPLADAFSHRPSCLSIEDDGSIAHNGVAPGKLYIIDEPLRSGDVLPHTSSAMPDTYEYTTTRELKLRLASVAETSNKLII